MSFRPPIISLIPGFFFFLSFLLVLSSILAVFGEVCGFEKDEVASVPVEDEVVNDSSSVVAEDSASVVAEDSSSAAAEDSSFVVAEDSAYVAGVSGSDVEES